MILLTKLIFMIASVNAFNPMDLYVDQKEGFSLGFEYDGTKYTYYKWGYPLLQSFGTPFKQLSVPSPYTRMLVGAPTDADDPIYPITSYFHNLETDNLVSVTNDVKVYANNDGTVSLKCVANGMFATWDNGPGEGTADCGIMMPCCLSADGICPTCRYTLVVGAITDLRIRLVGLEWGDPDEYLPSSPDQVDEDNVDNYTPTTTITKLEVKYEGTTTDTTIWERAWGFELSVSAEVKAGIPFVTGGSVTTTATASYDGKDGTEHTVSDTKTTSNSKTVECPPRTRCTLKYVANKLDDYNMPFTALVERTQDDGPPMQWTEKGIWRGVQAFNFDTIYCSTSLDTGVTNCPFFNWMK